MNSSESEGFESADEGISTPTRKKRLSSSNYSDNVSDQETKKNVENVSKVINKQEVSTDGWDNFDFETTSETNNPENKSAATAISSKKEFPKTEDTDNSGWEDFDDWGDTNIETNKFQEPLKQNKAQHEQDIKAVTEKLASTSTEPEGWSWGWGMNTILSSATAGITSITNQVSLGINTVLETGIGAPDPEELARRSVKTDGSESKQKVEQKPEVESNSNEAAFPFGNIFSGVSKFVESTGTKVISGGLDTLETIGKKTMEVLQDGDPLLAKKRAMLGLDSGDKPILSQILREAKERADEEDKLKEAKREAKEVHYETLFDDFEGLVHLEALEMLSKQINMRIEERLRSTPPEKRQDIKETLQQVAELCEMPEEDDEVDDDDVSADTPKEEVFHDKLQKATKDIGLKLQFQPLIKQYTDELSWLGACDAGEGEVGGARAVYKRAVGGLARATALAVQLYHRTAEMLLVKGRRSTADEADALTQMTVVLTKHISELATLFTEKLNARAGEGENVNDYITNVFLEAGNSSKYIENAFQLTLPIIQIGAV